MPAILLLGLPNLPLQRDINTSICIFHLSVGRINWAKVFNSHLIPEDATLQATIDAIVVRYAFFNQDITWNGIAFVSSVYYN